MKKFLSLFLVILTTCSVLVSCDVSTTDGDNTQKLDTQAKTSSVQTSNGVVTNRPENSKTPPKTTTAVPKTSTTVSVPTPTIPSPNKKLTITEQVLHDSDGVKITVTGVGESIFGTEIKIFIENNTDKDIVVQSEYIIVNNYMIDALFSEDVPAGKKANGEITLMGLDDAGITKIGLNETYMYTADSSTFKRITEFGHAEIRTNLYDVMDGNKSIGTTLMERDGIKVVAQHINNDSFWGKDVVLYIENNSDKDVTLSVENLSVNDFAIDGLDVFTVLAGKKTVDSITLFESELEENNIETVTKVEFKLWAYDPSTFKTHFTSDVITYIPE